MKKVLSLFILIVIFLISLANFFPYQTVTAYILKNKIKNISYSSIIGNSQSTTIKNVQILGYKIDNLRFKHNLLNILLLKTTITGNISELKIDATANKNNVHFKVYGKAEDLNQFLDKGYEFNGGIVTIEGIYNYKKNTLNCDVILNDSSFKALAQFITIKTIHIRVNKLDKEVSIATVESDTKPAVNISGKIRINNKNFLLSRLNLNLKMLNGKINSKITGSILYPKVKF